MPAARPVAILGGVRIPFCRQNTAYADVGNLGMSVRTLGALVERFGLHGQQLGEVAMGAVIKHSSDWNLAREAALSSGLSPLTPGITLQRACGTSLDSVITIANKIALGQIDSGIGGGSDTTSEVPIVYGKKLRARLMAANRAKATGDKLKALLRGFKLSELKPEFPAWPSRAPARAWATTARTWPRNGTSRATRRTNGRCPRTTSWPPPMSAASSIR